MKYLILLIFLLVGCTRNHAVTSCKSYCADANGYSVSSEGGTCSCIYISNACRIEQK